MNARRKLWHGGVGGLWRGDTLLPNMSEHRFQDGCAQCEAQRAQAFVPGYDPPTPHGFVYATSDRAYARYYASRAVAGWLYEVQLSDDAERSTEDMFPTWRASSATVLRVVERGIALAMREREQLFVRWGGTRDEFGSMVKQVLAGKTA